MLELDFREGGRYRFAYDTPEGQRMLVGGVYSKIEAPSRVEFSWLIEPPDVHAGIESQVTVSIAPSVNGEALSMYRKDVIIPFGFLSMSIQAVSFAWIYVRLFATWSNATSRAVGYAALGAVLKIN